MATIAWYCLAEILRAGATETGLVDDPERLPQAIDLDEYRGFLRDEAARLVGLRGAQIPWYLRQQALLYLAAFAPDAAPVVRTGRGLETRHYREMIKFLLGEADRLSSADFATLAVLSRRAFLNSTKSVGLVQRSLTPARTREIALRDPSFARELLQSQDNDILFDDLPPRVREDLSLNRDNEEGDLRTLAEVVLEGGVTCPLRNELTLLRFTDAFLRGVANVSQELQVITPGQVRFTLKSQASIADVRVTNLTIVPSRTAPTSCALGFSWTLECERVLAGGVSR